jgi:hypothetical protein
MVFHGVNKGLKDEKSSLSLLVVLEEFKTKSLDWEPEIVVMVFLEESCDCCC